MCDFMSPRRDAAAARRLGGNSLDSGRLPGSWHSVKRRCNSAATSMMLALLLNVQRHRRSKRVC